MSSSLQNSFNDYMPLTLKAGVGGNPGLVADPDLTGNNFICVQADYPFEMSINGTRWFKWDQGLKFTLPQGYFEKLWFRNSFSASDINIGFYFGSVAVTDTRLSIVHDPAINNLLLTQNAPTRIVPGTFGTLNAGITSAAILGTNNGTRRKQIVVTNLDGANILKVKSSAGTIIGTVFPQQPWTIETDDTLKLFNPNVGAINFEYFEIYYAS